ncbi:MAG: hypothetical protein QM737_23370 [Ferruginibacter sp.]
MTDKNKNAIPGITRSIGMGTLISMFSFYFIHVFGEWKVENYRPDSETTSTVLLHNKCAVLGVSHTLRPNTDISGMGDGIDGTKLAGSFMNFFDGHIVGMIILAILMSGLIFIIPGAINKSRPAPAGKS